MKITCKTLNGITFTEEFEDINDFINAQLADQAAIDDNHKVISLEINGENIDFQGNVGELYYKLTAK
ncbi:DUF4649 family protein [Lactococcus nasutitermitis]|uniref:DUF4649 family protein n=1 Tax=Lactococcus nasutitermitis TaxID=1652957 RepID=A0ABV9JIW5_9LACT|nr:DUF4649 family protein [Lactococcus nasutitermitis]